MFNFLLKKIHKSLMINSLYLYLSHFSDYLLSILILPFIARLLGPKELGYLLLAQTFGLFLLLIMEFGFSLSVTREIAKIKDKPKDLKKYLSEVFLFKILLIPVVIILSILIIKTYSIFESRSHYIWIVMFGSIFQGLAPTWFFQGIEKLKIVAISKVICRIIGFAIILFFIKDSQDGWIILLGYSLTSLFIFLYLFNYMIDLTGRIKFVKNQNYKLFWNNTKWLFLITIVPVLFQNGLVFLLGSTVNSLKLGLYFGAAKIYRAFNSLYGPIGQAAYPVLVSSHKLDLVKSKKIARDIFFTLLILGLIFFVVIYFFSGLIIKILLGKEFLEAVDTLKLFSIVLPLTAISHVLGRQWMLINNKEVVYFKILFTASIISFGFFTLALNSYNINAVPLALILYEFITIIMIILFKK